MYQPPKGPAQVVVAGAVELTGYQASTGERLWWVRGLTFAPAAPPVLDRDTIFMVEPQSEPEPFTRVAPYDKNKDGKLMLDELTGDGFEQKIWYKIAKAIDHHYCNRDGGIDEEEWKRSLAGGANLGGLNAIKLGGSGDIMGKAVQMRVLKEMPYVTSPLLYHGSCSKRRHLDLV